MTDELENLIKDIDYYKKMLSDPEIRIDTIKVKYYVDLTLETLKKIKQYMSEEIKNIEMFLAMRDIFYGGEFSNWLENQKFIPMAAMKEYEEAYDFFKKQTNFNPEEKS